MLGIVIYHTNLKINNQDCIFLRTSQFPIAIYNIFDQLYQYGLANHFNLLYSSSVTDSHHSLDVSSPGTSIARCENQLSDAAPC